MEDELKKLTYRCKQTGNAIIQGKTLPPEDKVIIVLDDSDEDLHAKYKFPLETSTTHENGFKTNQPCSPLPGTSHDDLHTKKDDIQLINTCIVNPNSIDSQPSHLQSDVDKREDSNIAQLPAPLHVPEEAGGGKASDSHDDERESITNVAQFGQSEDPSNKPRSAPSPSESARSQNGITNQNQSAPSLSQSDQFQNGTENQSTTSLIRSSQSQNAMDSQSALTVVQSEDVTCAVHQTPASPTVINKTNSAQEMINEESASTRIIDKTSGSANIGEHPQTIQDPIKPTGNTNSPRNLRTRKQTNIAVVIPKYPDCNKKSQPSKPYELQKKVQDFKKSSQKAIEFEAKGNNFKFFLGSDQMEKELTEILLPYSGNQTSRTAKLAAWKALTALLERRQVGEPLDQVFLDSFDCGTDHVVIRTQFNAQKWFEAIQHNMPRLFNSHPGEPAYSDGFFNTSVLINKTLADKVPKSVLPVWHHTWRSMRMSVCPSAKKVTVFLKILLDCVLLTGKAFLKRPPRSETEKAMTGVEAVCQAIQWLNSQKTSKVNNNKITPLLDANNLELLVDVGLIQEWQDVFLKVLDSYVVQYFEAKYILNEDARSEDREIAIRFKKE
ncbi:uncharacterized protein MELLADRAFT_88991 [Melampsora larici-populina 98AG31]|uniref:Uncharacterized protein n=1 Tax=Melampsora larici-populina (strain 98AG31 / pathotype 3-4-7) TaxID=747676 RepID=F4R6J3_MELLP|nr:uncharacterized protein MELLADRAFT_88991 [Melampsora larici-populina 98AG31]EGG11891.1 hypothetical protein MELLADRAFT_88991 [Melampsora larici-populina 98AG31]